MPRPFPEHLASAIDSIADRQGGFVLRSQLVAIRIPDSTISRLTRSGGPWQRVLPATYFLPNRPLAVGDRETAALLYAGHPHILTGSAALRHYGLRYVPEDPALAPIHVLIPHTSNRASRGFARIERTRRLPEPVPLHGLPMAPLPRALFDATRFVHDQERTRAVLLEALQANRVEPGQLEEEFRLGQRKWTALARAAVREFRTGSASAPEAEFREGWESRGFPLLLWNASLHTPDGVHIATTDGFDPATGMAVEIESREFHSGSRWAASLARQRRMTSFGVVVVPVVPSELRADADGVYADVLRARERLLGRPLPPVVVNAFRAA